MCGKFLIFLVALSFSLTKASSDCRVGYMEFACHYRSVRSFSNFKGTHVLSFTTCNNREFEHPVTVPDVIVTRIVDKDGNELSKIHEIRALNIENSRMNFVPNFNNLFENLSAIEFTNNGLLSLTKEDMKQFGSKLEVIKIVDNDLISLNGDLFASNTGLKLVDFLNNPLKFVDERVFDTLMKLENLEIHFDSGCMQMYTDPNQNAAAPNLVKAKEAFEHCNNEFAKLESVSNVMNARLGQIVNNYHPDCVENKSTGKWMWKIIDEIWHLKNNWNKISLILEIEHKNIKFKMKLELKNLNCSLPIPRLFYNFKQIKGKNRLNAPLTNQVNIFLRWNNFLEFLTQSDSRTLALLDHLTNIELMLMDSIRDFRAMCVHSSWEN